jgi:hypothetical protein
MKMKEDLELLILLKLQRDHEDTVHRAGNSVGPMADGFELDLDDQLVKNEIVSMHQKGWIKFGPGGCFIVDGQGRITSIFGPIKLTDIGLKEASKHLGPTEISWLPSGH